MRQEAAHWGIGCWDIEGCVESYGLLPMSQLSGQTFAGPNGHDHFRQRMLLFLPLRFPACTLERVVVFVFGICDPRSALAMPWCFGPPLRTVSSWIACVVPVLCYQTVSDCCLECLFSFLVCTCFWRRLLQARFMRQRQSLTCGWSVCCVLALLLESRGSLCSLRAGASQTPAASSCCRAFSVGTLP